MNADGDRIPADEAHGTSGDEDPFVDYYARQSLSPASERRFRALRDKVLRLHREADDRPLDVLDVGCGPGELSFLFAREGHRVHGLDINEALIDIARARAAERGLDVAFDVAGAEQLPASDRSQDIVVAPELLEHVPDWRACLGEMVRVLRPGGVLFVSTTNVLCPVQQEFDLPLYSWYPGFIKRRCIDLARTRKPEWVNYAEYPAFHWFSFYRLRRELAPRGFHCLDRFDIFDPAAGWPKRLARWAVQSIPGARFAGHVLTPYTQVVAIRNDG